MTWVTYRGGPHAKGGWRLYAVATAMHVITIVHPAVNMQPINDQPEALAGRATEKESTRAEEVTRNWITGNYPGVITPLVAGSLALWQIALQLERILSVV